MGIRILKGGMLLQLYRTVGARAIRARGSAYLVLWTAAPSKLPIFFWIIRKMKQFSNSLFLTNTGIYFRDDHRYHGR